ncbi:MAG: aspartate dehydrogenase [Lachnospiraceae bacterium]|nr:aspartate dehydrogenase [Lachnospiraceae bacterium]
MFWKKNGKKQVEYDKAGKIPVIRASICTGEKVAGFRDEKTGKFEDLMVVRGEKDLQNFLNWYGVEEKEIRREW